MKKLIILSCALLMSSASYADGLLRTTNLKAYCGQAGVQRQTVIYLDQGIIAKKDANWFRDIINKTKFFPGERLQVVTIKDGGGVVEEAWDSCYPSFTPAEYKKRKENDGFGSVFTGGVDDKLKGDLKSFNKWYKQALAHPLAQTRHETMPQFGKGNFPKKKLVEALYYDSARMDLTNAVSRVIIFSDMVENSEVLNHANFKPEAAADAAAKRFPTFFNHASVYIYGINYTNNETELNNKLETFWKRYLLQSGAHVKNYSTQLVLPKKNQMFVAQSYSGNLKQSDGRLLATSLRLAFTPDRKLIHSVFTIGDYYMPITGDFFCSGQNCQLKAAVSGSNFKAFQKGDAMTLSGSLDKMTGKVGAKDDSVIDEKGSIYRFDVEYNKDRNLSL